MRLKNSKGKIKMNDKIFLLSKEEYNKYRDRIPNVNVRWWLRSPGFDDIFAATVKGNGDVDYFGNAVISEHYGVRPALKDDNLKSEIGERIVRCGYTWVVIDNGLAIAEVPITFKRFDAKSNDYETSEIRRFLLDWYMYRKERT